MKSILNYQGNKNKLINFIAENLNNYIQKDKYLLDIFSGSASIAYYYFNKCPIYANDLEIYCYHIANALFCKNDRLFDDMWSTEFKKNYQKNYNKLDLIYYKEIDLEKTFLQKNDFPNLKKLYESFPTIWNGYYSKLINDKLSWNKLDHSYCYCLMTTHYSTSYFGILQAIQLDSIRYAIEMTPITYNKSLLLSLLYSVMSTSVFSKDGHMAQPLNLDKNPTRLFKCRNINIFDSFMKSIENYNYDASKFDNRALNYDLDDLLRDEEIFNSVGCIYADPPYTDMQYSRYYHLLTTITYYAYCEPTIKNGKFTAGLYLSNRNQSALSTKKECLTKIKMLMTKCKKDNINLVISFGYPSKISGEKTDRYIMNVDELILSCTDCFGKDNVQVKTYDYKHSNHRNSEKKKVIEYLICCRGQ